ncbi:MAG: aminotransferase class III-fold pyridoxal phosphate-dependent enzyme [Thermosyntropha sp.]|nr:aminotransferase class III-fold pyridoxal phosphate-dependent enzyme [Thermosyntropha sp.]
MTVKHDELLNPTLAKILKAFKLDKDYVHGEGNYLADREGRKYLDFIAQYGAVPFGYNPDFVWEALERVRKNKIPSLTQPSLPGEALMLAKKLMELSPGDLTYSTFCQSGAEAVEAAIKLARSATGKKIIVSTIKSFHGKTLGALSATGREVYQTPFGAPIPGFMHVPYNDIEALEEMFIKHEGDIAGFIVEPVQGEGGMVPARPGYLKKAQELCRKYGIVFIVDEIQTGLGRTGSLFACEEEGIEPDVMLLAKALGGGLVPLGVCLSSPRVYNDDFGSLHSSTFANNNLTCAVGSAVLDELIKDDRKFIREVKEKGDYLLKRAHDLGNRYSDIIKEVRGKGLMVGIEFYELNDCGSFDMAYLTDVKGFTALLAGFLLNVYNIRLAPFLNNPMTLRLEPPLTITYEEIDYVMEALEIVCEILSKKDYAKLYRYLLGDYSKPGVIDDYRSVSRKIRGSALKEGEKPTEKFAFVIHYPGPEDVVINNPSFKTFSRDEIMKFMDWQTFDDEPGIVCYMPAIRSKTGKIAEGWLIGIPYGGRQIMSLPREVTVKAVQKAVDLGRDLGAKIVGLGALSSVVTRGGRSVQGRGVAITSGNSFTTIMALEALFSGAKKMHIDVSRAHGAVVGATGSIGRACALIMSEEMRYITLLGNPQHPTSSKNRLNSLIEDMFSYAWERRNRGEIKGLSAWLDEIMEILERKGDERAKWLKTRIENEEVNIEVLNELCVYLGVSLPVTTSLDAESTLPKCDLIVAASNSPEYLVYSHHLKPGAVVCDVARPADVAPEVLEERNDVLILEGGLVEYPEPVVFGPNFGYRDGVSLACLSETVLLALEGDYNDYSIGTKLSLDTVAYLRHLGEKHGFKLAGLVMGGKEITDEDIEEIYRNSLRMKKAYSI